MRVLIIDFYHSTDNVGGLRWRKFAKYLPSEGIEPIILTSGDSKDDTSNVFHVPYYFNSSVSHGFAYGRDNSLWGRAKRAIRGNFFIPDPRRLWFSGDRANGLIVKLAIDVVITTGPPHSIHLIGLKLKKRHNIKWIADFRDPWFPYWYKDMYLLKIVNRLQGRLYKRVLTECDLALQVENYIVDSDIIKHEYKQPLTVSNGFDPDDFTGTVEAGTDFVYVGSLTDRKLLPPINFKHIQGVSHEQAIYEMRKAGYLLLAYPDDVIPSKVYEYMASGRPIISFGINGKGASLVRDCGIGVHISLGAIKDFSNLQIFQFLQSWTKRIKRNETEIQKYNVKNLTKQLAKIIHGTM